MKQLASIILALSVLLSSTYISVGTHSCGGDVKSIALFGKAKPCKHADHAHESDDLPPCHRKMAGLEKDKGCCEDTYFEMEGLSLETLLSPVFSLEHKPFTNLVLPPSFDLELNIHLKAEVPHYLNYKPPLIQHNLPVLFQSFLI